MDRFAALRSFAAVAHEGSFVGAAQSLDMSKAAVSKQVKALEEHLGAALFARTSRAVSLTEAGRRLLAHADVLLSKLEEAEAAVQSETDTPTGLLKVSASIDFGGRYVTPVFARFLMDNPNVHGRIDLSDDRVDLVEEGYDVAVRIARSLPDATLRARRLGRLAFPLVGAPAYFKAHGAPKTPEDLTHHACLDYAYGHERRVWRFQTAQGETREVRVQGPLTANSGRAVYEAALAGLGLARLPIFFVDAALKDGRLQPVLEEWCEPPLEIHAVMAPERAVPARIRLFLDRLSEALAGAPWTDQAGLRDAAP